MLVLSPCLFLEIPEWWCTCECGRVLSAMKTIAGKRFSDYRADLYTRLVIKESKKEMTGTRRRTKKLQNEAREVNYWLLSLFDIDVFLVAFLVVVVIVIVIVIDIVIIVIVVVIVVVVTVIVIVVVIIVIVVAIVIVIVVVGGGGSGGANVVLYFK